MAQMSPPLNKCYHICCDLDIYYDGKLFKEYKTGFVELVYVDAEACWYLKYGGRQSICEIVAKDIDGFSDPCLVARGHFYIDFMIGNQSVKLLVNGIGRQNVALFGFNHKLIEIKEEKKKQSELMALELFHINDKEKVDKAIQTQNDGDVDRSIESINEEEKLEEDKRTPNENEEGTESEGMNMVNETENEGEDTDRKQKNEDNEEERNLLNQKEMERRTKAIKMKIKKNIAKIIKEKRLKKMGRAKVEAKKLNKTRRLEKIKDKNKKSKVAAKEKKARMDKKNNYMRMIKAERDNVLNNPTATDEEKIRAAKTFKTKTRRSIRINKLLLKREWEKKRSGPQ